MNLTEHLLTCLAEECAEVTKNAAKSLRFGLLDTNALTPHGPDNTERLVAELNDLMGILFMLVQHGILPADWQDSAAQSAKVRKVQEYMDYAACRGALQAGVEGREL